MTIDPKSKVVFNTVKNVFQNNVSESEVCACVRRTGNNQFNYRRFRAPSMIKLFRLSRAKKQIALNFFGHNRALCLINHLQMGHYLPPHVPLRILPVPYPSRAALYRNRVMGTCALVLYFTLFRMKVSAVFPKWLIMY